MLSHVVKIIYKQEALSIVERVSTRNNCYLGKGTELQKVTKWSYYNPSNISKRAILVHVQIIRTYIIWISETNPTISMKFRMQGVSGSINRSSYSFLGNLIKKYWAKLDNPGTNAIDIVGEVSNRLWYKLGWVLPATGRAIIAIEMQRWALHITDLLKCVEQRIVTNKFFERQSLIHLIHIF